MSTAIYLSDTGERQGLISQKAFTEDSVGNLYQEGFEDFIFVFALNHSMGLPTDKQSGQPTGQRIHHPVTITKPIDRASPLLAAAMCSGERLTECRFLWYRHSGSGVQEHFYTTLLEDAVIVDISTGNESEAMSLSYRKITWEHIVSGTSGADDWRRPAAV